MHIKEYVKVNLCLITLITGKKTEVKGSWMDVAVAD